jgi:hypothetical protein
MLVNYRFAALMFKLLVPVFWIPVLFVGWDPDPFRVGGSTTFAGETGSGFETVFGSGSGT